MSPGWIGFICGLIVGAPVGIIVLALCIVAKRADGDIERLFSGVVPDERPKNTLPPRLPRY